jgi:hypothetical protein
MEIAFEKYLDTLKGNIFKPRVKIEWLRKEDESPYQEITGDIESSSGNLTINKANGSRRSVDLTLNNISGDYIPSFDGLFLRQKFKLYLGLEINGEDFFMPQGIFVLDNPTAISTSSKATMTIKGLDKFSLLDGSIGGETSVNYSIPVGSNMYEAIKQILVEAGDKKEPILHSEFQDIVTPYTVEKEIGDNIGDIIIEYANMLSANVYYDIEGRLVFEKDTDDTVKGSEWDYNTDEFAYLGSSQEYKFGEVFNAVLVIGDNINGEIFDFKAVNSNLLSDTSVPNVGFVRVKVIKDENIYSNELAEERAWYELKKLISIQAKTSINSVPMYHLDVDKVVTLTDNKLKLDKERVIINSISISFKVGGEMTLEVVKATELAEIVEV